MGRKCIKIGLVFGDGGQLDGADSASQQPGIDRGHVDAGFRDQAFNPAGHPKRQIVTHAVRWHHPIDQHIAFSRCQRRPNARAARNQ